MYTYKNDILCHHGIKGQRWGRRRFQNNDGSLTSAGKQRYSDKEAREKLRKSRTVSPTALLSKRQNDKVDKSFKKWDENVNLKKQAIDSGKKMNIARMNLENDPKNKDFRREYRLDKKEYKQALKKNTTYRKGTVRQEVGKDVSRKYLSEAKRLEKELLKDPNNRALKAKYNRMLNQHDIERAKARKAQSVGEKRMNRIRTMKSAMTKTLKGAAATAVIGVGLAAVNKFVLKDRQININAESVKKAIRKGKEMLGYVY